MKTRLLPFLFLFLPAAVFGQLDLTPREHTENLDGAPLYQVAFSDDDKTVLYQPPSDWKLSGGGKTLTLRPPQVEQAVATISVMTTPLGKDFGEESLKLLKEALPGRLPKEAQKIEVLSEEKNPLLMNRHETWRIQYAYSFYGQRFMHSVLVCNFAKYQLFFELDAREGSYPELHKAFIESLYSFHGLD